MRKFAKFSLIICYFIATNATLSFLLTLLWQPVVFSCSHKPPPPPKIKEYEGKIFIAVPRKLSLDTDERIAVVAHDVSNNDILEIRIKDYATKLQIFHTSRIYLRNGISTFVNIHLSSKYVLQGIDLSGGKTNLVVLLEATIGIKFSKSFKVHIDLKKGYLFLQTDKPIYNPYQKVQIRVIPLNEKLLPENNKLRVQIKNPQNVIVSETTFTEPWKPSSGQFPKLNFTLPPYPIMGKWLVVASFGTHFQLNSSVAFYVKEYVLSTFTVKVTVPNVILSSDREINVNVLAEYTYGKKVDGQANCELSIVNSYGNIIELGTRNVAVKCGEATLTFSFFEILAKAKLRSFPFGSRLFVNVSVTETATGNIEKAAVQKITIAKSPFLISFKDSLQYFKPGVVSVVVADITYVNGQPAADVSAFITVNSANRLGSVLESNHKTDQNGRIIFYFNPSMQTIKYPGNLKTESITVTVTTRDGRYKYDQQSSAKHVLNKFLSDRFIAISRTETTRNLKVGEKLTATVFTHPVGKFNDIYFIVTARSRILLLKHIPKGQFNQRQLEFIVTTEMSPVLRIVLFSLDGKKLLVDSVKINVESKCKPKAEVMIRKDFPSMEPGSTGKFILKGEPHTKVGILAVDNAVYALKNQNRLTKEKMFQSIINRNFGSGPGNGFNSKEILSTTGVLVLGNFDIESTFYYSTIAGGISYSCSVGGKCGSGGNAKRITTQSKSLHSTIDDYKDFYLDHDDIDESMEEDTQVRSDFRETWLFQDHRIGSDGTATVDTRLPDSITTWVMQAVSVSPRWGMCVSEPEKVKSFKNIFIQLDIPYSVIQNEQLNMQATVFSYFPQNIPVIVYMYGAKNLCSGVKDGEKSERKRITVKPLSAETVHFPVVPLKAQDYLIRVVALSPYGADVVVKRLHVLSEGTVEEEDYVIIIDPTNQQRRKRRYITTDSYSDFIDESKNFQEIKLNLSPKKHYIEGTESCVISAIGTEFGPTVETVILDPTNLIRMPAGCCEQTMMYLGPTVYTLHFLKSKQKISEETEQKLYNFIGEGYKRALTFRKGDGSYAIWWHLKSSIWLTSFVIKIFSQASKFIFIDKNVICQGTYWIVSKQRSDGSFQDPNPVIRRVLMMGDRGTILVTAFVQSVLHVSTCDTIALNSIRSKAKSFLEARYLSIDDAYTLALTAYALALSNSQYKHDANSRLLQISAYNEERNWRYWKGNSATESMEITAYALLTQLELHNMSTSLSIVNWMNSQRLYGGSFPSSQVTVIALQALSLYLIKSKSYDVSLNCNITNSKRQNVIETMNFDNDNAIVLQELRVDQLGGTVTFNATGRGVGLLSVKMRYNVPVETKQRCAFETSVNVSEVEEKFAKQVLNMSRLADEKGKRIEFEDFNQLKSYRNLLQVTICTRFLSTKDSEMTIIDAGLFSGFHPIMEDLDKLIYDVNNPVDRYEINERSVIFYLDHVPHKDLICVPFRIKRKYVVGNIQSSVVKIYDYYNNDKQCTIFYNPDNDSLLMSNICQGALCQCTADNFTTNNFNKLL